MNSTTSQCIVGCVLECRPMQVGTQPLWNEKSVINKMLITFGKDVGCNLVPSNKSYCLEVSVVLNLRKRLETHEIGLKSIIGHYPQILHRRKSVHNCNLY